LIMYLADARMRKPPNPRCEGSFSPAVRRFWARPKAGFSTAHSRRINTEQATWSDLRSASKWEREDFQPARQRKGQPVAPQGRASRGPDACEKNLRLMENPEIQWIKTQRSSVVKGLTRPRKLASRNNQLMVGSPAFPAFQAELLRLDWRGQGWPAKKTGKGPEFSFPTPAW